MAALIPTLATIGSTAVSGGIGTIAAIGTGVSTLGALSAARGERAIGDYQSKVADIVAQEQRVQGEQEAANVRRKGEFILSRAQAVGAASGGGVNPTYMGQLAGEKERQALQALWQGEASAQATEQRGQIDKSAAYGRAQGYGVRAVGTLLGGATDLYTKYAHFGPAG